MIDLNLVLGGLITCTLSFFPGCFLKKDCWPETEVPKGPVTMKVITGRRNIRNGYSATISNRTSR